MTRESKYNNMPTAVGSLNSDDNVLIGTGERTVKLGFVEIPVYSLKLYVNAPACRSCLGMDLDSLLQQGSTFYTDFVCGEFEKRFCLTFCRTISKEKLVGGFDVPLKLRCDASHQDDAAILLNNLVPPQGVVEGDVLSLVCSGDGETLTGLYLPVGSTKQQELVSVKSGGVGGAWMALQNIYFDDDTQLPTIRVTAISQLPNVFLLNEMNTREPSQAEIEIAVEKEISGKKKQTWSEFAGRTSGGEGYKFGDLTLGVVTAMGLRTKPLSRGALSLTSATDDSTTNAVEKDKEVETLKKQVKEFEIEKKELQDMLANTEKLLLQEDREQPFRIVAALALVEAMYILLDTVVDVYIPSLRRFQVYVVVAILLGGYKHFLVEKTKVKRE